MFQLSLRMTARPQHALEAAKALRSLTIAAQTERGYVAGRIYQEAGNPEVLCLEEDWSSEAALQSHIRSHCFTDLLMLMETAPQEPVLEVRSVREVHGLEYIEAVRFGDS
jgi:quinol monooxygenase YgiN